jgi:hypothetical protein
MILPGETPVFFVLPIFSPVAGFFVPVDKLHVRAKKSRLNQKFAQNNFLKHQKEFFCDFGENKRKYFW